jgi:sugar lactone lactonase YvrE
MIAHILLLAGCSGDPVAPGPEPGPVSIPGPGPGPVPDSLPGPGPGPDSLPGPGPSYLKNVGLWTAAGASPTVLRLAADQLDISGPVSPRTAVYASNVELIEPVGIAFDGSGTLWVSSHSDSVLAGFRGADIERSAGMDASIVISQAGRSLSGPAGLAFDAAHRLWASNVGNGTLVRFGAAQLSQSGAPVPEVVISGLGDPAAIAFDASGTLWVSDTRNRTISGYSAAQLEASGAPVPAIVLSGIGASLANARGIAFDAAGNLWVGNTAARTIVAFSPEQLAASGAPTPRVVLSAAEGALPVPVGLAFDGGGNLWVMSITGILEKFAAAALAVSGTPSPAVRLELSDYLLLWGLAFWPVPAGLPLN